MIEQVKFTCTLLRNALEKKTNTIKEHGDNRLTLLLIKKDN